MTRRDFIIVADALIEVKKEQSEEVFIDVSHTIAKHLQKTCSNFNLKTFTKYINTQE